MTLSVCWCVQGGDSRSPSVVSLTVETVLGSFDFLNASDGEKEEEDEGKTEKRSRSVADDSLHQSGSP